MTAGAPREPVLGVLGGMGPDATVEFMRRVLRATPARDDADHLRMIVDNNPKVPSRIAALIEGTGEDPGPVLAAMARGLEAAGADLLALPCNTAHHYLPVIREAVGVPVLDMVGLSVARLRGLAPPVRAVGLLASPDVRLTGLVEARAREAGIEALFPEGEDEAAVLRVIRAVKADAVGADDLAGYRAAAAGLVRRGAGALVLACTELSLVEAPRIGAVPVLDTLDVLVEAVVERCRPG